jgi:hypothetical protein
MKNNYKVNPNITKEELIEYGFRKTRDGYLLKVPAYRYKKKVTLLYLDFLIAFDDDIPFLVIDCKDNNGKSYIPFYNSIYNENNAVLKKVNSKMQIIIKDMIKNKIIHTKQKSKENK